MTNKELELLKVLYALLERIGVGDAVTAVAMVEHAINLLAPLAQPIANDVGCIEMMPSPPPTKIDIN